MSVSTMQCIALLVAYHINSVDCAYWSAIISITWLGLCRRFWFNLHCCMPCIFFFVDQQQRCRLNFMRIFAVLDLRGIHWNGKQRPCQPSPHKSFWANSTLTLPAFRLPCETKCLQAVSLVLDASLIPALKTRTQNTNPCKYKSQSQISSWGSQKVERLLQNSIQSSHTKRTEKN